MSQEPEVISLNDDKLRKLKEIIPGDFDFVLILRAHGPVDVCIRDDRDVVLKKSNGDHVLYKERSNGACEKAPSEAAIQSKTHGKMFKAATPIAWTAFQNCGSVQLGGTTVYC